MLLTLRTLLLRPRAKLHPMVNFMGAGRFAPTPSGDLHLGNLRTALLAYTAARSTGRSFRMRVEDLDEQRCSRDIAERQLADLAALGIEWDGDIMWQSRRHAAYQAAVDKLAAQGLVYECYCSRREILEAPRAPHSPPGSYPGTCRNLTEEQRAAKRAELAAAANFRQPALRLRAQVTEWTVPEECAVEGARPGHPQPYTGVVDDVVLRRGDGMWAYNLAVVVDDAAQGVDQVVRGEDLLSSAPRQAYLAHLLELPPVTYRHVPLMRDKQGKRLAKRAGGAGMTLQSELAKGRTAAQVRDWLLRNPLS